MPGLLKPINHVVRLNRFNIDSPEIQIHTPDSDVLCDASDVNVTLSWRHLRQSIAAVAKIRKRKPFLFRKSFSDPEIYSGKAVVRIERSLLTFG